MHSIEIFGCFTFWSQTFRHETFRYGHFGPRDISVQGHFGTRYISALGHFGPRDISVPGHFGTVDISVLEILVPETFWYRDISVLGILCRNGHINMKDTFLGIEYCKDCQIESHFPYPNYYFSPQTKGIKHIHPNRNYGY